MAMGTEPTISSRTRRLDPTNPNFQRDLGYYNEDFAPNAPGWVTGALNDRQKVKRVRSARTSPLRSGMQNLQMLRESGGYGDAEDALTHYSVDALEKAGRGETPNVNLHHTGDEEQGFLKDYANTRLSGSPEMALNDVPTLARLSTYARERLGQGLTPDEYATLQGGQLDMVESAAASGKRTAANAAARSGMIQTGGVASAGLESERLKARAGVGRYMTEANLGRKKDIESLALSTAEQEAARRAQVEGIGKDVMAEEGVNRRFDVGAEQDRLAKVEDLLTRVSAFGEARREYDTGFVEARKEATLNRAMYKKALKRAEPTSWEKTSGILNAVLSGLGGGGGRAQGV